MAKLDTYQIAIALMFCTFLQLSQQGSLPSDPFYTAGVVEFRQATNLNAADSLDDNLMGYINIIASEANLPTDIIVFPEATLNNMDELTSVPDAKDLVVPCDDNTDTYHNFLVKLSCVAKIKSKYVVVNLFEKELCSAVPKDKRPCAANGLNVFNTNVVFDRKGAVISRYRKVHLYGEPRNTTLVPEYGYFDTDFGVRFGHFICFDILFYSPVQEMVEKHGIKDFIMSTMWFSQLPFLTGVQFQSSWAYANDVNLLASGASFPAVGSTGTGIYNGRRGALVSVMNKGEGERTLYVMRVPKYEEAESRQRLKRDIDPANFLSFFGNVGLLTTKNGIFIKRDYLELYESEILNVTASTSVSRILCYKKFCCNFSVSWRYLNVSELSHYYTYRLGVYDGWRKEGADETNNIMNCALFACVGNDINDCGKQYSEDELNIEPQVVFEDILIEASYPTAKEFLLMPNTLKNDLMPLDVNDFQWEVKKVGTRNNVRFRLNTTIDNLLTFAAYGNYFDNANPNYGGDASTFVASTMMLMVAFVLNNWLSI